MNSNSSSNSSSSSSSQQIRAASGSSESNLRRQPAPLPNNAEPEKKSSDSLEDDALKLPKPEINNIISLPFANNKKAEDSSDSEEDFELVHLNTEKEPTKEYENKSTEKIPALPAADLSQSVPGQGITLTSSRAENTDPSGSIPEYAGSVKNSSDKAAESSKIIYLSNTSSTAKTTVIEKEPPKKKKTVLSESQSSILNLGALLLLLLLTTLALLLLILIYIFPENLSFIHLNKYLAQALLQFVMAFMFIVIIRYTESKIFKRIMLAVGSVTMAEALIITYYIFFK